MKKLLIYILLSLFTLTISYSQNRYTVLQQNISKRLKINSLNFEQGLQSNTINNIVTDKNGFLWVATETGLQRYNGYSFETIIPTINNTKISINYTVYLFLLNNNHLWISTKEGVIEFNPENQTFAYIIKFNVSKQQYAILPIKETATEIWYIEQDKGVSTFHKNTKKIERVFENIPINFINDLFHNKLVGNYYTLNKPIAVIDSDIYVASKSTILKINYTNRKYVFLSTTYQNIFALAIKNNHLLITVTDRLIEIDPLTEKIIQTISYANLSKIPNPKAIINKAADSYLLSLNNELYELDKDLKSYNLCTNINNTLLISVGFVNAIYADTFNRIWIITNNDIKRIQFSTLPFKHFYYTSTKNNFIKSIHYDESKAQIIAGSYGGGIQLYDTLGTNLLNTPIQNEVIKDVMNVIAMQDNSFLVTPYFNQWQAVNLTTKSITPITINPLLDNILGSSTVNFINNIKSVSANGYIIATSKNIFSCKIVNNTVQEALPIFNFLSNDDNYLAFLHTTKNTIWTGTRSGTLLMKEANGNIKEIENLGNYFIRSTCEDSTGNIWIGTDKGLHLYNQTGQLVKTFTTANGLRNDCIYAILPFEKKATVFVSTNLGLAQVNALDGSIKIYSKEIGLQENEFNTGAAYKTQSGKLLFGGINGISVFNPADLNAIETNLQIHLGRIVINDSIYSYPSSIWKSDTITLQNYENHIQFDIVANGVLNADEYVYQYRILGFEQAWQTTNKPINIRYTLEPGKYTLEIICTPTLSNGQKFTKKIVLHIKPAWHQLIWVRLLLLLITLAIVGAIVYQYQRIMYLRKIKELQVQNEVQKDRERISRELHDNLGTQLSYISSNADFMIDIDEKMSSTDRKQKLAKINTIAKSSIADLRETIWALKKVAISMEELSERIKLYAQSYADTIGVRYTETIEKNTLLSSVDALNIFRLCQEGVTNTLKYAKAKNITICFISNTRYHYNITLKDDGIGFILKNVKGEHYGIENMQTRAKELGANFEIISIINEGTSLTLNKENQKPN